MGPSLSPLPTPMSVILNDIEVHRILRFNVAPHGLQLFHKSPVTGM